jgi:hypothetical protein
VSFTTIATAYGRTTEGQISSPSRPKNFHFFIPSRLALRPTKPPIQWVLMALSPGVKWLGCEADQSPPISAKVKKAWIYTVTPPWRCMVEWMYRSMLSWPGPFAFTIYIYQNFNPSIDFFANKWTQYNDLNSTNQMAHQILVILQQHVTLASIITEETSC